MERMIAPELDRMRVEQLVGTRVVNTDLYRTAFTHKSALKQYRLQNSYETLEFLGDAVLGFIVTKYLFDSYQAEQEGFLTKVRTKIVRGKTLADIARKLDLGSMVLMDDKGMRNEWFKNEKILEDVFEAFIGAVYLDLGVIWAKEFVFRHLLSDLPSLDDDNYKDIVMRWCQANKYTLPEYTVSTFDKHIFNVTINITTDSGPVSACGSGKTKKDAEQSAASTLINDLKISAR
jgi:ribonuclease-3